jgi:hypothetical protein
MTCKLNFSGFLIFKTLDIQTQETNKMETEERSILSSKDLIYTAENDSETWEADI